MPTRSTMSKTRTRRWMKAFVALFLALSFLLVSASGALGADEKKKKKRRKQNYVLQLSTMKKLAKFNEYAQEEDYDGALEVLISLARRKSLKKHDRATVYQYMGYMYAAKEDYGRATKAMERSLKQHALPFPTEQLVKFNLGQLYMAEDRMPDAVRVLQDWYDSEETPNADANFKLAAAYMSTEQYAEALPYARKAVAMMKTPKERYYQVNLNCEFQIGNFLETLDLLKLLAMNFPKAAYYKQLAFGYTELGEMETALAVLQLAYAEGWLETERELFSLAQRLYSQDLPYQAAKILKKGLDDEIIPRTEANLEFLSSALLAAREYADSLPPLEEAAELSEDGDLYVRLAQVHLQVEDWSEAQSALDKAVAKGDLKDPYRAQLLLGITHFNQKRYKSARVAFTRAAKNENLSASATQWIEHTDRQLRQQEFEAQAQG